MDGFQYTHGDRPLEGYTIQRAVGRGGFGEVYYALSDAGREVALKAIHGFEQIEVRGVSQCMNLKSPHLVSIFDIKHNAQGKAFVVMEYVNGPSLKDLLEQSPAGMGAAKTAFFMRELAKGLSFLHERGIVHRDLKPGNVFYEDGYVKIGDYGLSKAMGISRHSGQTITVGTVQYMAPEVGMGKYDRSIDIYAMGIVLYEMLTGQVPFFGSSHGEILMKHLMSQPDLTGIEEPFATVIRKAMAKDPADRYQSAQEMVEAVFGAEHVRNSVSCFSPDSLTMVAGRVAQKVTVGAGGLGSSGPAEQGYGTYKPPQTNDSSDVWTHISQQVENAKQRVTDGAERLRLRYFDRRTEAAAGIDVSRDPLKAQQRRLLAFMTAVVVGAGTGVAANLQDGFGFFAIPIACLGWAGLAFASKRFRHWLSAESNLIRHLALGGTACAFICLVLPVYILASDGKHINDAIGTLAVIGAGLLLLDWYARTAPDRKERVSLDQGFFAALAGWIGAIFLNGSGIMAGGTLAAISLAVQAAVPFDPIAAKRRKENEKDEEEDENEHAPGRGHSGRGRPVREQTAGDSESVAAGGQATGQQPHAAMTSSPSAQFTWSAGAAAARQLPGWVRIVCIGLFILLFGTGLLLLIAAGVGNFRNEEFGAAIAFGVGSLAFAFFFLWRATKQTYASVWSGMVRPFLMFICLQSAFAALMILSNSRHLRDEELLLGLAFVIFPALLFFVIGFISDRSVSGAIGQLGSQLTYALPARSGVSTRDAFVALMLSLGGFFGLAGLHRFYTGRYVTGLLWLCTFGLFGAGTIFDIVMISTGMFRDGQGLPLRIWMGMERTPPTTTRPRKLSEWPVAGTAPAGDTAQAAPEAAPFSTGRVGARLRARFAPAGPMFAPAATHRGLAALGGLLMLAAITLGFALSIDLPRLVAAGFPDPQLNRELTDLFGYAEWPRLVWRITQPVAFGIGAIATALLLIARRRCGAIHMGRVIVGAGGLLLCLIALRNTTRWLDWATVLPMFDSRQVGRAIENLLDRIDPRAIVSGGLLLVSLFILVWPERRERIKTPALENTK